MRIFLVAMVVSQTLFAMSASPYRALHVAAAVIGVVGLVLAIAAGRRKGGVA